MENGVSKLEVVVGVLALEVYPQYVAAAFLEGEASSLSSVGDPGLSNRGAELELVLDSTLTSCVAGLVPTTPSIM